MNDNVRDELSEVAYLCEQLSLRLATVRPQTKRAMTRATARIRPFWRILAREADEVGCAIRDQLELTR